MPQWEYMLMDISALLFSAIGRLSSLRLDTVREQAGGTNLVSTMRREGERNKRKRPEFGLQLPDERKMISKIAKTEKVLRECKASGSRKRRAPSYNYQRYQNERQGRSFYYEQYRPEKRQTYSSKKQNTKN